MHVIKQRDFEPQSAFKKSLIADLSRVEETDPGDSPILFLFFLGKT